MVTCRRHADDQANRDPVPMAVHPLRPRMGATKESAAQGVPESQMQIAVLGSSATEAARNAGETVTRHGRTIVRNPHGPYPRHDDHVVQVRRLGLRATCPFRPRTGESYPGNHRRHLNADLRGTWMLSTSRKPISVHLLKFSGRRRPASTRWGAPGRYARRAGDVGRTGPRRRRHLSDSTW